MIQGLLLPNVGVQEEGVPAAERLYQYGEMQPLCDFIEQRYLRVFDNRDYRWANELTIKTLFLTLLFNNTFYIVDSEPALQRSYADFLMRLRPEMRQYQLLDILIEFEYVSLSDAGMTGEQARTRKWPRKDRKTIDYAFYPMSIDPKAGVGTLIGWIKCQDNIPFGDT